MTKNEEPTVQVPVSLIERAKIIATEHRRIDQSAGDGHSSPLEEWTTCSCGASITEWQQLYDESDEDPDVEFAVHIATTALLSQPTPSAAPLSIAEMAPGTTFAALHLTGHWDRFKVMAEPSNIWLRGDEYEVCMPQDIDPSTIRDVTPPKEPTA